MVNAELEFVGSFGLEGELIDAELFDGGIVPSDSVADGSGFGVEDALEPELFFTEPLFSGSEEIEKLLEMGYGHADIPDSDWRDSAEGGAMCGASASAGVAVSSNPLAALPGSAVVENEIMRRTLGDAPYCIVYISINGFKAYNNAYGFKSGDMMLRLLLNTVMGCATRGEFVGRVGGDSLIVICDHLGGDKLCRGIIDVFAANVGSLYREVDANNGFIVTTNNYGVVDCFPIASLSIAGISNRSGTYKRISEFSKAISQLQEKCMGYGGNYYEIL